jgi:hypothetical protein
MALVVGYVGGWVTISLAGREQSVRRLPGQLRKIRRCPPVDLGDRVAA